MESGECDRCCGTCRHWFVLDDHRRDPNEWVGCCLVEMEDELGSRCRPADALDWAYVHMRGAVNPACPSWEEE